MSVTLGLCDRWSSGRDRTADLRRRTAGLDHLFVIGMSEYTERFAENHIDESILRREKLARHASWDELAQSRVAISAHDDEIRRDIRPLDLGMALHQRQKGRGPSS
jgi:hypothetical protein